MTWIKSHLLRPDGSPIEGQCVTATLMLKPSWLRNATGQVVHRLFTNTDAAGLWRLDLLPYTQFEHQLEECIYYRITEGDRTTWNIRVPEVADPATELWLRDVVVDVSGCQRQEWIGINTLSRLHDVDRESLLAAKPGDVLVLLANGKWGAGRGSHRLAVTWWPAEDNLFGITASVSGFGGSGARLEWGDGTHVVVTGPEAVPHVYAQPGVYTLTAVDLAWPAFTGTAKVTIKPQSTRAHVFVDSDDDWRVLLWLDEPADSTNYLVDWGDGSVLQQINGQQRVPPHPRTAHQYTAVGVYYITVTDTATMRQVRREYDVGEIGQIWTFPTSPLRPRVEALWFATGSSWQAANLTTGEVTHSGVTPPHGRVRGELGENMTPGTYETEFREIVGGRVRRRSRRDLIIPTIWDHRLGVDLQWRPNADNAARQDITVTATGARANCVISWGDGSPEESVAPGTPATHTYDLTALPAAGWKLQVTEIGVADPRVWTRLVARPRHVGQPVLNASTAGAVDLDVQGVEGYSNSDWYQINWGDGTTPAPVAAVGSWYPAHHIYANEGTYTITVDGPGMAEPIVRTVTVIRYPAPTVVVTEAKDNAGNPIDPSRRTVAVTVNNRVSGGPCEVHLGDNSAIRECAEVETFTHRYTPPSIPLPPGWEIYYVIATSKADRTAKGMDVVQMPFGTERTLYFTIDKDPADTSGYTARLTIDASDIRKTVQVEWGDGTSHEVPVSPTSHPYLDPETYEIRVSYTDNSESYGKPTQIPFAAEAEGSGG